MITNKELCERLYGDLHNLIWAMVWDICKPERWMLEADEIFGELSAELVKSCYEYEDKPYNELKAIAITCMRNRRNDLVAICHGTHRNVENVMLNIDDDVVLNSGYNVPFFDIVGLLEYLTEDARALVVEVICPSDHTVKNMELVMRRKKTIAPKNHWKFEPNKHVFYRSMGWDRERFEGAWEEVQEALTLF